MRCLLTLFTAPHVQVGRSQPAASGHLNTNGRSWAHGENSVRTEPEISEQSLFICRSSDSTLWDVDASDEARIESLPVADTQARGFEGSPFVTQQFPVKQPAGYRKEFVVPVLASSLSEARARLDELSAPQFPWRELALAISMLTSGAALSAWVSEVTLDSLKGILFFVLMPLLASASFVAYLFLHKFDEVDRKSLRHVVALLPDPDDTSELGIGE